MDYKDYLIIVEEILVEDFCLSIEDFNDQDISASFHSNESPEYCAESLASEYGYSRAA